MAAPLQPIDRERIFQRVLTRAVTSPVSLFLACTGLLLIGSPHTWAVGLTAFAAEAGWVWFRIRDPEQARTTSDEMLRRRWRELVHRQEALTSLLDRETSTILTSIVEAQERLLAQERSRRPSMPSTRIELTSLLQHCLSLAEQRHHLHSHLVAWNSLEMQREAAQLQARMESSPDPVTRQLYDQALDQKRQELENYVRVQEAVQRIDGQLAVVHCTFDNMLSRLVRMQSADALSREERDDPVFEELNQLNLRVAALEASVSETLVVRSGA